MRAQLLTRLNVITLFEFTYVTKNNPAASVYYTDLVCFLKITLTGQAFEEVLVFQCCNCYTVGPKNVTLFQAMKAQRRNTGMFYSFFNLGAT